MKRPLIAPLAAALAALAATAAPAAEYVRYVSVDPVTGTRIERIETVATPVVDIATYPATVYEDRVVPRETIVVEAAPVADDRWPPADILLRPGYPDLSGYPDRIAALNPQTGQLIGYGLFNERGPNDFGGGTS